MGTGTQHFLRGTDIHSSLWFATSKWSPSECVAADGAEQAFQGSGLKSLPHPTIGTAPHSFAPPTPTPAPGGTTNMAFLAEAELSRGLGTAPHAEQGRSRLAQGHRSDLGGGTDTGEGGKTHGKWEETGQCEPQVGWEGEGR